MSSRERNAHGAETTTEQVTQGLDLEGRVALVTGASGGLGAETARALAARGASVTLSARDVAKAEGVAEEIRSSTGNPRVDVLELELTRTASIRAAAERWLGEHEKLHWLVNNAGIMACPLERTSEGYELQMATNHFGHFLFTGLLVPALRKSAPSRIVNLSSAGHRMSDVVLEDLHYENRPYDKWESYGQSKTANILFSVELNRRLADHGVTANAVHPGMILTELGRHLDEADIKELMARRPDRSEMTWKSVEAGAATSVWACVAPELEGEGGLYLEDCQVAAKRESEEEVEGYAPWAMNPDTARKLWEVSERAVGEHFNF